MRIVAFVSNNLVDRRVNLFYRGFPKFIIELNLTFLPLLIQG